MEEKRGKNEENGVRKRITRGLTTLLAATGLMLATGLGEADAYPVYHHPTYVPYHHPYHHGPGCNTIVVPVF